MSGLQQKMAETLKIKVRMGQNPSTLNILNPEINRMEYIEVFSLLAKAAEMIEDGETCIERNAYVDGPTFNGGNYRVPEEREQLPPAKREEPKPSKPSRLERLRKKLSNLISEDDDNEDEQ